MKFSVLFSQVLNYNEKQEDAIVARRTLMDEIHVQ